MHSSVPASPTGDMPELANSRLPESECRPTGLNDRWTVLGVCIFLAVAIWLVFGQTLRHDFVNYDDNEYVYKNPVVQKGLTWEGFRWALTYGNIGHWHPLTWLSHMLDCQLYGMQAGGHHLTNILLHTATAILLFLVLGRMTGALWRSAFVAAVFAIHPLRVESVAWVAERKDVLSGLFFMLTVWAYARYAQRQSRVESRESSTQVVPALDPRLWTLDYYLVLLFFALGLLSKNMLVTTPFVLLLLDYWPLNRLSGLSPQVLLRRVTEKIPLFVLTVASCVATVLVPEKVAAENSLSFALRMENAAVSYITYLWQMIHPSGLACVYPNPASYLPFWQVAGALGLLLAISGAVWAFRKTHPCLLVGWLWYLGMMIPVIGIVQISYYAHADRYTYLPQIGLYLLLTWAVADLCVGRRNCRWVLGGCSAIILMVLIVCARTQASYWRNSESLWAHTLSCTSNNNLAHYNLGYAYLRKGNLDEAIVHFQKALEIKPDYAEAHNNLGNVLLQKGSVDEAIVHYQKALEIKPDYAEACYNLGNALLQKDNVDEALVHFQKALDINPNYVEAHNNLGIALLRKDNVDKALVHFQKALEINPDNAEAHYNLGTALLKKGSVDEAISHFQKSLEIKPDHAEAHYNLGTALLQRGNVDEAISHFQKALETRPGYAEAHNNLGTALLRKGSLDEAIVHFQKALEIKPDYAEAHYNLGNALLRKGSPDEAISHYQKALEINPSYVEARNNLAWVLATCPRASLRNGNKAVQLAQRANQLTGGENPTILNTLAAAYAEAGHFPEAVETAQRALQLAGTQSNTTLADAIRSEMKLYQAGIPFHSH
jgi:tetratricopeptide (TPR) repeat protein